MLIKARKKSLIEREFARAGPGCFRRWWHPGKPPDLPSKEKSTSEKTGKRPQTLIQEKTMQTNRIRTTWAIRFALAVILTAAVLTPSINPANKTIIITYFRENIFHP